MTCPICFSTIRRHSETQAQACYRIYLRRSVQMRIYEYAIELEQQRPSPSWFR